MYVNEDIKRGGGEKSLNCSDVKSSSGRKLLNYINVFRAIAILVIVIGHCVFLVENPILKWVNREIFSGGTVFFVFIAGFLFEHLQANFEYKKYLLKKFINVIMPYLITSVIGIIILFSVPKINLFSDVNPLIQIPMFLLTGLHNPPTWYIPMTTVFFILAPVLLYLEHKKVFDKPVVIILLLLLFTIFYVRPVVGNLNGSCFTVFHILIKRILKSIIHFLPLYILGMIFSSKKDFIKLLYKYRVLLIIACILTFISDVFLSYKYNINNSTVAKSILALLIIGYLEHYDEIIIQHKRINNLMDIIAKYSFGIFFFHNYFIFLYTLILKYVFHLNFKHYIVNSSNFIEYTLCCTTCFIFVVICSFTTCYILKYILNKMGIKNTRMFIGA